MQAESQWQQNINFFFAFPAGVDLREVGSAAAFLDMPGLLQCAARMVAASIEVPVSGSHMPQPSPWPLLLSGRRSRAWRVC